MVVLLDYFGIVCEIVGFFSDCNINIEEMEMGIYVVVYMGMVMFLLEMLVNVLVNFVIVFLKEVFVFFCDECNLDVIIEFCR